MAQGFLKRLLPNPGAMRQHRSLAPFARLLHDPNLWHLNRRSVSLAALVGIFVAFIPIPIHMLGAALLSIWVRCNITIALVLVWISNPLTIPPIFYATYQLGAWMMGEPTRHVKFELTLDWFGKELDAVWQPLLLGSFSTGLVLGSLAYVAIRVLWRMGVLWKWRRRQQLRKGYS